MLFSLFLGKPTEGVMTDPCKEVTPGSTKIALSSSDQVNSHVTSSPSEDPPKLQTHLNKTHVKLPERDANYKKTPLSYEEHPELWPILEHPAPRPCLEVNTEDWSISSIMTPPSLDWSCVASTPQNKIQPPQKDEEGVFNMEIEKEKAALEMLGVEEYEDYVTYDPIRWKLWQERNCEASSRFRLQTVITPQIRSSILEWLSSLGRKLDCSLGAWCLAVNYLDKFMCVQVMGMADYGLAGITALLIASKQVDPVHTTIELVSRSAAESNSFNIYCKTEYISQMKVILLRALKNQLDVPTVVYFLLHLSEGIKKQDWWSHFERHMVEMVLFDRLLSKCPPSKIALAIFDMIKTLNFHISGAVSPVCPKCEPTKYKKGEDVLIDKLFDQLATILMKS